jgi:hypothetical protein
MSGMGSNRLQFPGLVADIEPSHRRRRQPALRCDGDDIEIGAIVAGLDETRIEFS